MVSYSRCWTRRSGRNPTRGAALSASTCGSSIAFEFADLSLGRLILVRTSNVGALHSNLESIYLLHELGSVTNHFWCCTRQQRVGMPPLLTNSVWACATFHRVNGCEASVNSSCAHVLPCTDITFEKNVSVNQSPFTRHRCKCKWLMR